MVAPLEALFIIMNDLTLKVKREINPVKVFKNAYFGEIRTSWISENPYFCLVDVCRALDLDNPRQVKTRLEAKGVIIVDTLTDGGKQGLNFINEPNLYRCVFQSRKDEAIAFQNWFFEDVIPSILKSGGYGRIKPMSDDEIILQAMLIQQRRIERSGTLLKNNARKLSELRYRLESEKERRRGKYLLGIAESQERVIATIDMFIESPYFKVLNGATYLETIYLSFLDFCRESCIVCEDMDKKKISKRLLSLGYNKRHGRRGTFFELCED